MIVITGAAGFIGSVCVSNINKKGRTDIMAVDVLGCEDRWKNLNGLQFNDYIERDDLPKLLHAGKLGKIDAIIHMGADSSTTQMDMSFLVRNNYEYTKTLAEYCVSTGTRFIYASSAATYGDGAQGYTDDETKLETLQPLNPYGFSKQLFDLWARQNGYLKRIVGLKFFNVYGPNEYHKKEMRSMIHKAFGQVMDTGKVKLFKSYRPEYKDGEQVRDFIYVTDAVEMILHFLENRKISGIFNVGTGEAQSWNRLATAVFSALNKPVNIEYIDMPENIRNQYQYYTKAEITKIRQSGYTAKITPLEDGIRDYVQKYLISGNRY